MRVTIAAALIWLVAACGGRTGPRRFGPHDDPANEWEEPGIPATLASPVLAVATAEPSSLIAGPGMPLVEAVPVTPQLIAPPVRDYGFAVDGEYVVYVDEQGSTRVVPAAGGDAAIREWLGTRRARFGRMQEEHRLVASLGQPGADVVHVSDALLAVMVDRRVFRVDVPARTLAPAIPTNVLAVWPPAALADGRSIAVIRTPGQELWVADLAAGTSRLAGRTEGEISPFLTSTTDGRHVAYSGYRDGSGGERDYEIRWADLVAGTDRLVATARGAATVVFHAVPHRPRAVAHVEWRSRGTMAFYDLDFATGAVRRIGPELPGWANSYVSPDATRILVAIGPIRQSQPVPPPTDPPPGLYVLPL